MVQVHNLEPSSEGSRALLSRDVEPFVELAKVTEANIRSALLQEYAALCSRILVVFVLQSLKQDRCCLDNGFVCLCIYMAFPVCNITSLSKSCFVKLGSRSQPSSNNLQEPCSRLSIDAVPNNIL